MFATSVVPLVPVVPVVPVVSWHVQLVHEDPKPEFSCSWCNSKFKLHRKFGSDDKGEIKYQCKDCQKIFCILRDLQRHRKLKHKHFKRDICERGFSTKYNLSVHKEKNRSSCESCSEIFCTKLGLFKHKKTVHGESLKIKEYCVNYTWIKSKLI